MKLLTVDTIEEAREKIAAHVRDWQLPVEQIAASSAAGRVLAEDIFAGEDIPGFRRSTVDGYAVVSADTAGSGDSIPVFLKKTGSVEMGKPAAGTIRHGECAYVPTGGMIPAGADAVVMAEYAESAGGNIAVYEPAAPGAGIAEADEDMRRGEIVLRRGTCLRYREAGALAALGRDRVPVYGTIRLALFSTGDELAAPGKNPRPGEVRDSNSSALRILAESRGCTVVLQETIPDDPALLEKAVRNALNLADVAAVSGGSSRGEKDFTAQVFSRAAEPGIFTQGLAIKPGKPTILGYDRASQTLLCGLPGHPISAIMVFEILLSPLYRRLTYQREPLPVPAVIGCDVAGTPGKACCQPVTLHWEGSAYRAEPVFGKSGMITTLTRADGYIIIGLNREGIIKGEAVCVHLL